MSFVLIYLVLSSAPLAVTGVTSSGYRRLRPDGSDKRGVDQGQAAGKDAELKRAKEELDGRKNQTTFEALEQWSHSVDWRGEPRPPIWETATSQAIREYGTATVYGIATTLRSEAWIGVSVSPGPNMTLHPIGSHSTGISVY